MRPGRRFVGIDLGARALHVVTLPTATGPRASRRVRRRPRRSTPDALDELDADRRRRPRRSRSTRPADRAAAATRPTPPSRRSSAPRGAARSRSVSRRGIWVPWPTPRRRGRRAAVDAGRASRRGRACRAHGPEPLEVYPAGAFRVLAGGRVPPKSTPDGLGGPAATCSRARSRRHRASRCGRTTGIDATVAALTAADHVAGRRDRPRAHRSGLRRRRGVAARRPGRRGVRRRGWVASRAMPPPVVDRATDRAADRRALRGLRAGRRAERLRHVDWIDALYRAYMIGHRHDRGADGTRVRGRRHPPRARRRSTRGASTDRRSSASSPRSPPRWGCGPGRTVDRSCSRRPTCSTCCSRRSTAASWSAPPRCASSAASWRSARSSAACSASPSPTACRPASTGTLAPWLLAGAAAAVLIALTAWSAALLAVGPAADRASTASLIGLALVGWSVADVAAGHVDVAVHPRRRGRARADRVRRRRRCASSCSRSLAIALVRAGHVSLEPALQRARLVQSLRFAATFQDLRAVITIRHQLAHETPRVRPWFRLPGRPRTRSRHLAARLARRAALAGQPRRADRDPHRSSPAPRPPRRGSGTTPFLALCAIATYAIALDVTEGFAQETDHPDIGLGLPEPLGPFMLRHLVTPVAILAGTGVLGVAAAVVTARVRRWPHARRRCRRDRDRRGRRARRDAGGGRALDVPRPARPRPRGRDAAPRGQLRAPGRAGGDDRARVRPDRRPRPRSSRPRRRPASRSPSRGPAIAVAGGVLAFLRTRVWQAR